MAVAHIGVLYKRLPMAVEPRDMGNALSLSCSLPGVCFSRTRQALRTQISLFQAQFTLFPNHHPEISARELL